MGCELTKLASSIQKQPEQKELDAPKASQKQDPRLPLTDRQKYIMISSWKGVQRAMEDTGVNMFLHLFEENKELLDMFTRFKYLKTKEEQWESQDLKDHATKVMTTLNKGIEGLNDLDSFLTFLHQIGASHTQFPGFNRDHFWKIEQPFLKAVKLTLDDRYTDNIAEIYKLTINFIISTLIEGFDEAQRQTGCNERTQAERTEEASGNNKS